MQLAKIVILSTCFIPITLVAQIGVLRLPDLIANAAKEQNTYPWYNAVKSVNESEYWYNIATVRDLKNPEHVILQGGETVKVNSSVLLNWKIVTKAGNSIVFTNKVYCNERLIKDYGTGGTAYFPDNTVYRQYEPSLYARPILPDTALSSLVDDVCLFFNSK